MRVPTVFTATEIVQWHVSEQLPSGKWRPARPCSFEGITHFKTRCRIAWRVFTGKLDALNWESGSGERPATDVTYADFRTPGFKNAALVEKANG